MPQPLKNFYEILEIPPYSDMDTVRSAYRKLARTYHPDLNPGNAAAEERFKAINEAYDMLSSPERKAFYDESLRVILKAMSEQQKQKSQQSKQAAKPKQAAPPPAQKQSGATNINDLFDNFLKKGFGDTKKQEKQEKKPAPNDKVFRNEGDKPKRGADVSIEAVITPLEAKEGTVKTVNVQHNDLCRRCAGTGRLNGKVCPTCQGETVQAQLKKMDVKIPPGVKNGSKVRVAGEGARGQYGGENGDLFLQIKIEVDASLRIEGLDVYGEQTLGIPTAVLGGDVQVSTLHGKMMLNIPPLTSSGKVLRLKEQGVHHGNSKGDHYVTVRIIVPENLSPQEKALYQELARLRPQKLD